MIIIFFCLIIVASGLVGILPAVMTWLWMTWPFTLKECSALLLQRNISYTICNILQKSFHFAKHIDRRIEE